MGCKDLKTRIRSINDTQIQPIIQYNDFLRQNMLNYARNQFSSEAKKLQPANVGPTDFTNIYNMSTAWDYVLANLHEPITLLEIGQINNIIAKDNYENIAGGAFRNVGVSVLGQYAPNPQTIYQRMDDAIYHMNFDPTLPLTNAFNIHYDIITIQPFADFNKRTARIVMNWYLLQQNFTPILFNHQNDDIEYTNKLRARLNGDCKTYSEYMCDRMLKTQQAIVKMLTKRTK